MTDTQKPEALALRLADELVDTPFESTRHEAAAELRRLQAENEALRVDAERYRWLRSQFWQDNKIAVVIRPKDQTLLGSMLPYGSLLDGTIDHMSTAMKEKP